ncbi:MAG: hypothetical protein ACTSYZ_12575 [Candidatus Helarchaeota archaeon]
MYKLIFIIIIICCLLFAGMSAYNAINKAIEYKEKQINTFINLYK